MEILVDRVTKKRAFLNMCIAMVNVRCLQSLTTSAAFIFIFTCFRNCEPVVKAEL